MDVFAVLKLLCGLALFLYGMKVMGQGLEQLAGSRFERILERLTGNRLKGVLLGAGVTSVIQSSSATTVMVVGFVNSGIMKLRQAIGVIMGANIGTTVTAWILSLAGIESDNLLVRLLKPDSFTPILAIIGVAMIMMSKKNRRQEVGGILVGFAVLMTGMSMMSAAVSPLTELPAFVNLLVLFKNPLFGILAGALLTAVIQSSSASVGILQALALTGSITFDVALPIILGQNIGTCVTALISCIGANKNAKQAAMVHLYFNIIGTFTFLPLYYITNAAVHFGFAESVVMPVHIAIAHSAFNIFSTLLLLPLAGLLERLARFTIRSRKFTETEPLLDERLLITPSIALEQCRKVASGMAETTRSALYMAVETLDSFREDRAALVQDAETQVDMLEDKLGNYLVRLAERSLSMEDSRKVSMLLQAIGDFERISDHARSIAASSKEMRNKSISFSEAAVRELSVLSRAVCEIVDITVDAFANGDDAAAKKVEPLEQVVDGLVISLRKRHIDRLRRGECTIELGFILTDLLTDYSRVSDHCSNIAVLLIELLLNKELDSHQYLNAQKKSVDSDFSRAYEAYTARYTLPPTS